MVGVGGGGGGSVLQWLVWIQLLVMILLVVLLYCFSLFALEISDADVRVSVTSGAGSSFLETRLEAVGSSSIQGEISPAGVSRRGVGTQNGTEGDAASVKDATRNHAVSETQHHPCSVFKFAREAFLKCLGLDCTAESSDNRQNGKTD